jgi:hypothetical protein
MPQPRHPDADDAQDRRRSDEHADDDEQHVCRGSVAPLLVIGSVLVPPFSVCAVVHTQGCSPAGESAHQTGKAVLSPRWVLCNATQTPMPERDSLVNPEGSAR